MPEIGESVCFYTHEQMDTTHRTIDRVGIVLAVTEDYVDLKVLELGRAPYDERAYTYKGPEVDAGGRPIVGKSYWRDLGSDAPDFESDFAPEDHEVEPPYDREVRLLEERQELERANWTGDAKQLDAKFALERKNIDERYDMHDDDNGPDEGPIVDAQNPSIPAQSGQPAKPLFGKKDPDPQVPPTVGNKSLPSPL